MLAVKLIPHPPPLGVPTEVAEKWFHSSNFSMQGQPGCPLPKLGSAHLQENGNLNLKFKFKSYFPAFSAELPLKPLLQLGCRTLIRSSGTSGREHQLVPCHFIWCFSNVRPTHFLLPTLLSTALLGQETTERWEPLKPAQLTNMSHSICFFQLRPAHW